MKVGFYISRYCSKPSHLPLWKEAVHHIRAHYPTHTIIVVDDGSPLKCVNPFDDVEVVYAGKDEKRRGELCTYAHFLTHKPFDVALMLHDGMLSCPCWKTWMSVLTGHFNGILIHTFMINPG